MTRDVVELARLLHRDPVGRALLTLAVAPLVAVLLVLALTVALGGHR